MSVHFCRMLSCSEKQTCCSFRVPLFFCSRHRRIWLICSTTMTRPTHRMSLSSTFFHSSALFRETMHCQCEHCERLVQTTWTLIETDFSIGSSLHFCGTKSQFHEGFQAQSASDVASLLQSDLSWMFWRFSRDLTL